MGAWVISKIPALGLRVVFLIPKGWYFWYHPRAHMVFLQFIFCPIDATFSRNFRMNKFRKSRRKLINAKKKIHLHFTHCRFFFRTIFRPCRIIIRGWCSTLKSWLKMRFWALIKLFNSTDDFLVEFDGEHFSWIFPWQEYDLVNEDVDISNENAELLKRYLKWSNLDAED